MTPALRADLIATCKGRSGPRDGDETLSFNAQDGVSIATMRPATIADILERDHIEVRDYATNGETHVLRLPPSAYASLAGCLVRRARDISDEERAEMGARLRNARTATEPA
jgi:hypothetical protein